MAITMTGLRNLKAQDSRRESCSTVGTSRDGPDFNPADEKTEIRHPSVEASIVTQNRIEATLRVLKEG